MIEIAKKYGIYLIDPDQNIHLHVFESFEIKDVFNILKDESKNKYEVKFKDFEKRKIILYKINKVSELPEYLKSEIIEAFNSGKIKFS